MKKYVKFSCLCLSIAFFYIGNVQAKSITMTCTLPGQGENAQKTYSFTVDDDPAEKEPIEQIKVWSSILRNDILLKLSSIKRGGDDNHLTEVKGNYIISEGPGKSYVGGAWTLEEKKISSPLESIWSSDFAGIEANYRCKLPPK